jgi:hypothetical protein
MAHTPKSSYRPCRIELSVSLLPDPQPEREPLRSRLLVLRRDALRQLAEGETLDGGLLRLVADAGVMLAALEEEAETKDG